MNELNEEIKLTLDLMQTDIDDGAHSELQSHLHSLLDIKRNEICKRLIEADKPLTVRELKAGGWWCEDVSAECARAFESKGLRVLISSEWGLARMPLVAIAGYGGVTRWPFEFRGGKQIHRIGNEFYWSYV